MNEDRHFSLAECWRLTADLLDPGGNLPHRPIRLSDCQWGELFHFLTLHLVAPTVYASLPPTLEIPIDIRRGLSVLHEMTECQNDRLREILLECVGALNDVGILPIPLKGSLALLPDQYPFASARVIGDIDLAVPKSHLSKAVEAMLGVGFRPDVAVDLKKSLGGTHHHLPPLFHQSGYGYVELHRSITKLDRAGSLLSFEAVQRSAALMTWRGVSLAVPSLVHRLAHNSVHQHLQDSVWVSDRRSLRQLFEFARLQLMLQNADSNWGEFLEQLDLFGLGDVVRLDLLATSNLFRLPLPDGVSMNRRVLAVERRFWSRLQSTRYNSLQTRLDWIRSTVRRLPNLPSRLVTPSWYPAKWAYVKKRLSQSHRP